MRTKHILGMILSAVVWLTSCEYNDKELWDAVNGQAARIAALEQWQTTINSNISTLQGLVSALENNDYVTGVTSFTTPAPGGYTITFTKSSPITLYHGTNGTDGKDGSTPVIGVGEYPSGSGVYYWTIDGEWLTTGGQKMAVTGEKGADGATPKLAIGSDGYWYISANGTATGTAPGTGWVNTGVKAIGDTGGSGKSDGIFTSVDNTDPDYVTFILANGQKIDLPKYRTLSISFSQPEVFIPNKEQVISYSPTGTAEPTDIWTVDIPTGWNISVDTSDKTITITPPKTIEKDNSGGTAKILIADGDRITGMYELKLKSVSNNLVGSTYYENGKATGVIYIPTKESRDGSGRVISLEESNAAWAESGHDNDQTGCDSYTDGRSNMATMAEYIRNNGKSWSNFPAFAWIHNTMNGGTANYTDDATGLWYFPAPADLQHFLCAVANEDLQTWTWLGSDDEEKTDGAPFSFDLTTFNSYLTANGGEKLSVGATSYRLSREQVVLGDGKYYYMWYINFEEGLTQDAAYKDATKHRTRAILAF